MANNFSYLVNINPGKSFFSKHIIGSFGKYLIWVVVSLSLKVTECGSLRLSKSTVMPNGIATSSVLAYLLPIDPELSSTRWEMSCIVRAWLIVWTRGVKSVLLERGSREHLRGEMTGGREKYVLCSSPSLTWRRGE